MRAEMGSNEIWLWNYVVIDKQHHITSGFEEPTIHRSGNGRRLLLYPSDPSLGVIASAIAYNFTKLRKFPPSVWGKLTTLLQIVSAIAWMAHNAWPAPVLGTLAKGLLWPTAVLTVGSGVHYIWRGTRMTQQD